MLPQRASMRWGIRWLRLRRLWSKRLESFLSRRARRSAAEDAKTAETPLTRTIVVFQRFPHNSCIARTKTTRGARAPVRQAQGKSLVANADGRTDARLGGIVRVLMEHPTLVVSGTKIAQEISLNR